MRISPILTILFCLAFAAVAACSENDDPEPDPDPTDDDEYLAHEDAGGEEGGNPGVITEDAYVASCIAYDQACNDVDGGHEEVCQQTWEFRHDTVDEVDGCLGADVEFWDCMVGIDCEQPHDHDHDHDDAHDHDHCQSEAARVADQC